MPRSSPRLKLAYLAVALLAGVLSAMLWSDRADRQVLERADRITLDLQSLARGSIAPNSPVLIVSVDDATLARLNSPVPDRALLAQGIDRLAAAGARVIALDMLLLDPSRVGPVSDNILAESMRRAGNVLIPFALPDDDGPRSEVTPTLLANTFMRTKGDPSRLQRELQPSRVVMPIAPLADAAAALGHVSSRRGLDGALRFDLPGLMFEGEVYPTLALRIVARAQGLDWKQAQLHFGERVELGRTVVPLDAQSRQWVNYYGPKGTFETISFLDLIDDRVPDSRLAGRIVIVGAAALASGDTVPSPFDAALPGFERVATVTDNILSGRVLVRPGWADSVELLTTLLLPLLAVALIASLRLGHALALLGLLVAALAATLQTLFVQRYLLLAPAFPLMALSLAVLGALVLRGGAETARRRAAMDALLQSEERYALALRGANDGMWDWDIAAGKVFFSARWLGLMSLDLAQASGMGAWTSQLDPPQRQAFDEALADHLAGRSQQFHHVLNFRQGGAERWLLARGIATRDNAGKPTRMAGSLTDISQQQQLQRQITFDALHDRLTGLPNRAAFLERLGQAFAGATGGTAAGPTGVVLVDIDGFRALNESEGTTAADAVLYELGRRLRSREGQALNVARLGADRFGLLFSAPLVAGGVDEARLAAWTLAQFKDAFRIGDKQVHLAGSVGWAHTAQGPATADELMGAAEMALAHAKAHRRGHVHAYDPAEQLVENSRRWLKENIALAIKREEFRLHYQPLVRLADRQLLGFEALVRWPHPTKGMVMPGDFIPFAEESGQILEIGRWTLLEAARQLVRWDAEGFTGEIAVNLSGAQFSEGDLEADARAVLSILGDLSPRRIKLEVTESMAMSNPQLTAMALQSLATLGFKISIDDFGTGYSSLAYLHRFPFDTLKIDRSFVMRLASGREAVEIVRTIVGLALALDKQVLAEGVEDETQARMLQELGVHVGQGWLFAKALPEEQARALIGGGPVGVKA